MDFFDKEFEYILKSQLEDKKIEKEEKRDYCMKCNAQRFYCSNTDNMICEKCGSCVKAYKEYHSFLDRKSKIFRPKSQRHKYLRLKKKFKIMNLIDEKIKDVIKMKFSQIIKYFEKTTYLKRKNILRYDYIIIKFLEIINEKDRVDYKLNLTRDTIKKYDKIWEDFCELYYYNFISTPL